MKITVIGERCTIVDGQVFVGEAKRVYPVEFVFDDSWDGYTATAVFESAGSEPVSQLLVDGKCFVPWEVLIPNVRFRVGVFGVKDNVERPTIWTHYLPVAPGTSDAPEAQPDPTPGMYTQMLQLLNQHEQAEAIRVINEEARKDAEDARQDAEAKRATAEAQRVANDTRREQVWESQVLAAGDAAKRAESAAKTAEDAIKGVDEAATAAVKKAQGQLNQSVSQAQEQAASAQEAAHAAKQSADRTASLIDSAYNAAARAGEAEEAAKQARDQTVGYSAAANVSATAAKSSETNAANRANAAATSEAAAKAAETAAKESEAAAKASENAAKASENAAKAAETAAKASDSRAANSAADAKASETAAKLAENNAKASEGAAQTSASKAAESASESANNSAKAAASEANAKTSETAAATSAASAEEAKNAAEAAAARAESGGASGDISWYELKDRPFGEDYVFAPTSLKLRLVPSGEQSFIRYECEPGIIEPGNRYVVLWAGVEYETYSVSDADGGYSLVCSDFPFYVSWTPRSDTVWDMHLFSREAVEDVVFAIRKADAPIKKIDAKYLPPEAISWDALPDRPFGEFGGFEILLEPTTVQLTSSGNGSEVYGYILDAFTIVEGEDYIVTCNGVEYEVTGDSDQALGVQPFAGNGVLFIQSLGASHDLIVYTVQPGVTEVTVAVKRGVEPYTKQIDPKYLPNFVARTEGTGEAYTATIEGITELYTGLCITIIPHVDSESLRATLDLNSLGPAAFSRPSSIMASPTTHTVNSSFLRAGAPVPVVYTGTSWMVIGATQPHAGDLSGVVPIKSGGTGANNLTAARNALRIVDPVQPDWAQSDSAQLDFIKHKPFGATRGEILVREVTLNPSSVLGGGFGFDALVAPLELGKTYLFTCNGVDYPCEAVEHTMSVPSFGTLSGIGLGNTSGTTGEPFTALYLTADQAAALGGIGILYKFDPGITQAKVVLRELVDLKRIPSGYLPEGLGGGVTSWNDLEDKPFGEVEGSVRAEIFPESELGPFSEGAYPLTDPIPLEIGAEYVVVWNGTEYTCTGLSYEEDGIQLGVALGNLDAAMNGVGDSGHPFVVAVVTSPEAAAELGFAGMIGALDGSTTASLAIYAIGGGVTVFPEATVNSTGDMVEGAIDLVEGGTYLVTWDGTVYECVCQVYQEDGVDIFCLGDIFTATQGTVGTAATGEPFVVMGAPGMGVFRVMDLTGEETATLKIAKPGGSMVVKTIDPKYLPKEAITPRIVLTLSAQTDATMTTSFPFAEAYAMEPEKLQAAIQIDNSENAHTQGKYSVFGVQKLNYLGATPAIQFWFHTYNDAGLFHDTKVQLWLWSAVGIERTASFYLLPEPNSSLLSYGNIICLEDGSWSMKKVTDIVKLGPGLKWDANGAIALDN